MPWYSIIPVGLGLLMLWAFITIFSLFGYINCTNWDFFLPAPSNDVRIIGALKNTIYVQSQDGTIYCNAQNGWKKCGISTFVVSHKDAPRWLNSYFKFIPEDVAVIQIARAGNDYLGYSNVALLENRHIWSCPYSFKSEVDQLMSSGAVIWLVIPAVIGFGCMLWFLKIFAESGSPTYWDFWGRGTRVK
jgi:hypothetical protein